MRLMMVFGGGSSPMSFAGCATDKFEGRRDLDTSTVEQTDKASGRLGVRDGRCGTDGRGLGRQAGDGIWERGGGYAHCRSPFRVGEIGSLRKGR